VQVNEITPDRLRRLAGLTLEDGHVLSVYLDLDPSEFGTAPARASAITSIVGEARRAVEDAELSHDERVALRNDVDRLEAFFDDDFSAEGAHAIAIFASSATGLFEVMRLGRPVDSHVVVDRAPQVEPLARVGANERWAVAVIGRGDGRILRGSADRLVEIADLDEDVHGRHQQGGWSQARYQRSVDGEARDHVARVCDELLAQLKRRPFRHLAVVAPEAVWPLVERALHPYVAERLAGHVAIDLQDATADDVHREVAPLFEEFERGRERELLDRAKAGVGAGGRGTAGLDDVLGALVERRVEALLLADGFAAEGVSCPRCGWLGVAADSCPVDGGDLEHGDVVERAIEAAVLQDADVVFVGHFDDLGALGGIAAVLRF
jgi:peptide chain release factor subunit 1